MTVTTQARITGVVYLGYFVLAVGGALIAPGTGPGGPSNDAAARPSFRTRRGTSWASRWV